jgi:hypothetical protein
MASSTRHELNTQPFLLGHNRSASAAVAAGQTIAKYAPLGRVTTTGLLVEAAHDASDGSALVVGIASDPIDTTAGAASSPMWVGGDFNADLIQWGASWTASAQAGAFDRTMIAAYSPA